MAWKALSQSRFHTLKEVPFKTLKNGRSRFKDLEMNLLSGVNFSFNVYVGL